MDIRGLGYLRLSAVDLDAWSAFATNVLGVMVTPDEQQDAIYLRVDDQMSRISLVRGQSDHLVATGWELADGRSLAAAERELKAAGVEVERVDADQARVLMVEEAIRFCDPSGNRLELFHSPLMAPEPVVLHPLVGSFVTGDMGLGHVVLPAGQLQETFDFYMNVLGFVHRDSMLVAPPGVSPYRMRFLACNPRHHSVALTEATSPAGLRHIMLHMADVIDVGRAFDRANRAGVLKTAMGQHSNDLMLSFYAIAPGGIDVEVATLGSRHDNATWSARELVAWKAWGYEQPKLSV